MSGPTRAIEPDPELRAKYGGLYRRWLKTYEKLLGN
jgi:hypothetical protein